MKNSRFSSSKRRASGKKKRQVKRGFTYLYILQSMHHRKSYVGVTNDPCRRLRQHNGEVAGGARYTSRYHPWIFYAIFRLDYRKDALSVEWHVKHRRSKKDGHGIDGIVKRALRHGKHKSGFCQISA